jgi:hypothetical protein
MGVWLAYVEVLADELKQTITVFPARALDRCDYRLGD